MFQPANKNNYVGKGYILNQEKIEKELQNYEQVEWSDLCEGDLVKNINNEDHALRPGGRVVKITEEYVMVGNGSKDWPLKKSKNTFYRKIQTEEHNPLSHSELHDLFEFMSGACQYNIMRIQINKNGHWKNLDFKDLSHFYEKNKHKKLW